MGVYDKTYERIKELENEIKKLKEEITKCIDTKEKENLEEILFEKQIALGENKGYLLELDSMDKDLYYE